MASIEYQNLVVAIKMRLITWEQFFKMWRELDSKE